MLKSFDVVIIGAGAAGLMCAISAGSRGKKVAVLDRSNKVGKKILMSGGGRCNFTNLDIQSDNFLSHNRHFFKSALSRYTQWDFIALVEKHGIKHHEKKLGQLFCTHKSKDILTMLMDECAKVKVQITTNCDIHKIKRQSDGFQINSQQGKWQCQSLVIATGGLSIPKMGATGFGYDVARQFGLKVNPTQAALVPFTLIESMKSDFKELSGTSVDALVSCNGQSFRENILFTHRGLSGPAILQISSYWNQGDTIGIDLLPDIDFNEQLKLNQSINIYALLAKFLTKKLAKVLCELWFKKWMDKSISELSKQECKAIVKLLHQWQFIPNGTEGYRTAEVTKGGVNTDQISSKSFESHSVKGLFFIGEVLDVNAHLGGYNFQWAWSSGFAAGQFV